MTIPDPIAGLIVLGAVFVAGGAAWLAGREWRPKRGVVRRRQ